MRVLGEQVYDVPLEISKLGKEPFEDEGGIMCAVVLSTSHCNIHTWPLKNFFVCDVYSCRDFDVGVVEEVLAQRLLVVRRKVTDLSYSLALD